MRLDVGSCGSSRSTVEVLLCYYIGTLSVRESTVEVLVDFQDIILCLRSSHTQLQLRCSIFQLDWSEMIYGIPALMVRIN